MKKSVIFVVLIFLLSCGRSGDKVNNNNQGPIGNVKVMTIKKISSLETFEAVGNVHSNKEVTISGRTSGFTKRILVKEGDRVKKGDLLVNIDDKDLKSNIKAAEDGRKEAQNALKEIQSERKRVEESIKMAEANFQLAEKTYKRFEALYKEKAVSNQEFDEVRNKYEVASSGYKSAKQSLESLNAKEDQVKNKIDAAENQIEAIEHNLDYTNITAPFDGVVTMKFIDAGQLIGPGQPILKIESIKGKELWVSVGAEHIKDLKKGLTPKVFIGNKNREYKGKVVDFLPTADPRSHTTIVKIKLPEDNYIRIGMYGKAVCRKSIRKTENIFIPISAVKKRGQLDVVYAVDDNNILRLRMIQKGRTMDNQVEVLSGLEDGDILVISDVKPEWEGHKVRIKK